MKALVVEDERSTQMLLRHSLESLGYEIMLAADGIEALEIFRHEPIHLIISDWMMPGMEGTELCRSIRAESFHGYVYFLLITSRSETRDVIDAFSAEVDDYITKPFEPAELAARLRTADRILALETRDMAIFAMAKLAESRDPETGGHLERVREYSRAIAVQMGLQGPYAEQVTPEFVRLLYITSPLHDIGKVSIPDHVLLKPGRLDDREFEIMKTHAQAGADTLAKAMHAYPKARFLRMAWEIALYHHEWYDGTGYPTGLRGQDIPLAARVFTIADVYDALSSRRVYKEAYSHETARSIIVQSRGTQFDPEVVRAFLDSESMIVDIRQRFAPYPDREGASGPASEKTREMSA